MLFCPKCNKIVPEEEAEIYSFNPETLKKVYKHCVWSLGRAPYDITYRGPNFIGGSTMHKEFCGILREPTPEEYFVYQTLKCK